VLWVRYHINYLRMWRKAAKAIANAVKDLGLNATVYVVGGAAENRLTVLSDVDVAIVLCEELYPEKVKEIRRQVMRIAIDKYELPWDYPVDIHVMSCEEFRKMFIDKNKSVVKVE